MSNEQQQQPETPANSANKTSKASGCSEMVAERTKRALEAQKKAAAEYAVIIKNNKANPTEKAPAAPSPATEGNAVSSSSLSPCNGWLSEVLLFHLLEFIPNVKT